MTTAQRLESPPLQNGARLLPFPVTVKVGTLVPQKVDAEVDVCGVRWLRVQGGLGNRFDREDWIADLPGVSVIVSDYNWNGSDFGPSYDGGFEGACRGALACALDHARARKVKMAASLATLASTIERLETSTETGAENTTRFESTCRAMAPED